MLIRQKGAVAKRKNATAPVLWLKAANCAMRVAHLAAARYMGDYSERTVTISIGSVMINALFGIGKLVLGISLLSAWFVINAVYDLSFVRHGVTCSKNMLI